MTDGVRQVCITIGAGPTMTFAIATISGKLLLAWESKRDGVADLGGVPGSPVVWNALNPTDLDCTGDHGRWWYAVSNGAQAFPVASNSRFTLIETEIDGATWTPGTDATIYEVDNANANPLALGTVTAPTAGELILAGYVYDTAFNGTLLATPAAGWDVLNNVNTNGGTSGPSDQHPMHLCMAWDGTTTPLVGDATIAFAQPYAGAIIQMVGVPALPFDPTCDQPGQLAYDVYEVDAAGFTYLETLCTAFGKTFTAEHDGTGRGEFWINRYSAEATEAVLGTGGLPLSRFVKVRMIGLDPLEPLFGFWLETGDFTLLAAQGHTGRENLHFSGRGPLAYLDRGMMADKSFLRVADGDPIDGEDPFDNLWRLFAAGTGSAPGQILWRIVRELQHPDRVIDGEPSAPIPQLDMSSFTTTLDSGGDAWETTDATAEFAAQVGDRVLGVSGRLLGTGKLVIECDANLKLNAYNRSTYGRDLTGAAFGAGVVRFVRGVNIKDTLERHVQGRITATHGLVQGDGVDVYGSAHLADAATRPHWEQFSTAHGEDVPALDAIAAADLEQREARIETQTFPVLVGDDELVGLYKPGPAALGGHYWLGDRVTVATGTSDFDLVDAEAPIASITISEGPVAKQLRNLRVVVELGTIMAEGLPGQDQGTSSAYGGGLVDTTGGSGGGGGGPHSHSEYQKLAAKGVANGYAGLNAGGLVPRQQLGTGGTGAGAYRLGDDGAWHLDPPGVGPRGVPGEDGEPGADSYIPGPPGPAGAPGAAGADGPAGAPGAAGEDGATGDDSYVPGPPGPAGADGATGADGPAGAPGPSGEHGDDGADSLVPGPPGNTGATGAAGDTGPAGAIGPPGEEGNDGADSFVPGPTGPAGATGDAGAAGADGTTGPPGSDGEPGEDGEPVPGPQGPQGTAGAAGATGPAGPTGPPGMDGIDGNDGADGLNGLDGQTAAAARVSTVAIANTETVVVAYACKVSELAAGTTFLITAYATQAGTNAATPTIRVRVGSTTLTGNIAATLTGVVGTSAVPCRIDGLVTVRTAGAAGSVIGGLLQTKSGVAAAVNAQTGTVAVDTTALILVELTFISGQAANTYTFQEASIVKVKA